MKRSQLDSREQMTYAEPERRVVREHHREIVQAKPRVTETVQRVEENKRTEEVERRVIRREQQNANSGILQESNQRFDKNAMNYKIEANEAYERSHKRFAQGAQTQQQQQRQGDVILQKYSGRRYTADELNQAVKRAYQAVDKAYNDIRQWRSNSMQRGGGHNGYLPAYESYNRSTSTRRDRDRDFGDFSSNRFIDNRSSGLAHARYGSLSDSLRRGELKYVPNGDVRDNYNRSNRMHKSYSTRDVFHDNGRDASWRRGSAGPAPLIEFPPTLPRSGRGEPPLPPPHRGYSESNSNYRPISKSRSYADWDEGRGPFGSSVKRYDDDMARLENEFRDSLLMRLPNGNMNEKDYRHEQIPGGHETYSRESKANSGRRLNREGVPSDFKEASQEYSFKREVQH
uniref:Uncharacterized protein n=1 Tax=Panagrolaimus superbus TaxID=310955 RepID=A0A914YF06_9BILA